jgi:hypothetical protein
LFNSLTAIDKNALEFRFRDCGIFSSAVSKVLVGTCFGESYGPGNLTALFHMPMRRIVQRIRACEPSRSEVSYLSLRFRNLRSSH